MSFDDECEGGCANIGEDVFVGDVECGFVDESDIDACFASAFDGVECAGCAVRGTRVAAGEAQQRQPAGTIGSTVSESCRRCRRSSLTATPNL